MKTKSIFLVVISILFFAEANFAQNSEYTAARDNGVHHNVSKKNVTKYDHTSIKFADLSEVKKGINMIKKENAGNEIIVTLSLVSVSDELTFNQEHTPDNRIEYRWEIRIDTDDNIFTGDYSGYDVAISLTHFKPPGSSPYQGTILSGTQHNTWILDDGSGSYGHGIEASINYETKSIIMVAQKSWEELVAFDMDDPFTFNTYYLAPEGGVQDVTSKSQPGSNIIFDPEGDVDYSFIDILSGEIETILTPGNDELAVDFGSNGLWHYDVSGWSSLAGWNPDGNMVDWDNGLAVDFGSYGLWNHDGSFWTSLASWDPADMEAYNSGLVVDFEAYGLWYHDGSSWISLAGWNPASIEEWSGGLAVDFGTYGLWNYDGSSWASLAGWDPVDIKAYGPGLAVDFDSFGLWYYDGSLWSSLAGWDPDGNMEVWSGGLAVDFGSYGLWNYDGSSWISLAGWDPADMEVYGTGLTADFDTYGLWYYDGSTWTSLASWNPEDMEAWASGLAVDFGTAYGLWHYDGSSWSSLAGWDPEDMIDVDLY